jgi:hypothetical protein
MKGRTNKIAYTLFKDEAGESAATTNVCQPEAQTRLRRGEAPLLRQTQAIELPKDHCQEATQHETYGGIRKSIAH